MSNLKFFQMFRRLLNNCVCVNKFFFRFSFLFGFFGFGDVVISFSIYFIVCRSLMRIVGILNVYTYV